jgi:hypothetical protein
MLPRRLPPVALMANPTLSNLYCSDIHHKAGSADTRVQRKSGGNSVPELRSSLFKGVAYHL